MSFKSKLHQLNRKLVHLPKKYYLVGLLGLVGVFYLAFFLPKTITLSYSQATCTRELTIFPAIHQTVDDESFSVNFGNVRSLGDWPLLATTSCFTPVTSPEQGEVTIATAPWGSWFGRQYFTIEVPPQPRVNAAVFEEAIPTTRPLEVTLDRPDTLHVYQLAVDDKVTDCQAEQARLKCDIEQLDLKQAATYKFQMQRQFPDDSPETVSSGTLKTLKAVKVVKSSVKSNQTIYAKPRKFKFVTDKPVVSAVATLRTGKDTVPNEVSFEDKTITVSIKEDLDREKDFELTLDEVEASDASTLADRYQLKFKTSGGPKVANVSIGSSGVGLTETAVITFDQAIDQKSDIAKHVSMAGGAAAIARQGDRQVAVSLQGLPRCQKFTIKVTEGLESAYGIASTAAWSYSSRTTCYTTSTYGTSLQGRPLVAYHFGNSGPVTLYTGAIHGNEISSMYMMQSWIAELEANPDKIGKRQIVIIPNINPDGVAAGTRNNSRNVNLSRNFPTDNWVKDIDDTDGHNKGGGGKKQLSEPEAAALARFTQNLRPRLLLSYHAIGGLVVGDGHGTYSGGKAAQYASMVGYRNATGQGGTFDYDITGAYEDWTWRNIGIPSMVIELGSYSYHNFGHHRAAMWAMLD